MPSSTLTALLLLAVGQSVALLRPAYALPAFALAIVALLAALAGTLIDAGGLLIGSTGLLLAALARLWPRARGALLALLGAGGLLLATHRLPGFNSLAVAPPQLIGAASIPYALNLNFDKGFAGLLLLLAWPPATHQPRLPLRHGLLLALPAAALPLLLGWASGLVTPDLKLHPLLPAFLLGNLLLTVVAEQAFFHGLIGRALLLRLPPWLTIVLIGLLFAALHRGPPLYLLLVALSGMLHATLYAACRRLEPGVLAHWLMNAGHFVLLTYPR